jgi:hypothetical protein
VRERELVVFFRNNHFSTVFKLHGALFLLVTDQGYLHEAEAGSYGVCTCLGFLDKGLGSIM